MRVKIKERPINMKLTSEAIRLLDEAAKELGISRTAAVELAVRKVYARDKSCDK